MPEEIESNTKKIYLTLPLTHIKALEIIGGGARKKSEAVIKILEDYVDFREDKLKKEGKYIEVKTALDGSEFVEDFNFKLSFLKEYVEKYNQDQNFAVKLLYLEKSKNKEGIEQMYNDLKKSIID